MSGKSGYQVSDDAARNRERYSVRYFLGPWVPGLVGMAALQPGERVLDLACGSGIVARAAAAAVGPTGRVTGLDISQAMLATARSLPPPPGAPIAWVEGDAGAMDFPDAAFDAIACQQGLQFFPDKLSAVREMRRVLAPSGRAVVSVWKSAGPYNIAVAQALERHVGAETAARYRASRVVPDADALYRLFVEAAFRAVEVRASALTLRLPSIEAFVLGHLSGMPIAGSVAALSTEQRAALASEVKASLKPYADGEGVAVPDEVNVAVARA